MATSSAAKSPQRWRPARDRFEGQHHVAAAVAGGARAAWEAGQVHVAVAAGAAWLSGEPQGVTMTAAGHSSLLRAPGDVETGLLPAERVGSEGLASLMAHGEETAPREVASAGLAGGAARRLQGSVTRERSQGCVCNEYRQPRRTRRRAPWLRQAASAKRRSLGSGRGTNQQLGGVPPGRWRR